jgi:hypothetical protein
MLRKVSRYDRRVDALVRENFGPEEGLWDPLVVDHIFRLDVNGKLAAVCTLQKRSKYWLLGDLCVAEKRKGHGTRIILEVMNLVWLTKPILVRVNSMSEGLIQKTGRFLKIAEGRYMST